MAPQRRDMPDRAVIPSIDAAATFVVSNVPVGLPRQDRPALPGDPGVTHPAPFPAFLSDIADNHLPHPAFVCSKAKHPGRGYVGDRRPSSRGRLGTSGSRQSLDGAVPARDYSMTTTPGHSTRVAITAGNIVPGHEQFRRTVTRPGRHQP